MTEPLDLPMPDDDDRSARAASLRSRAAVQAGDLEAWLALFADDGVVADPVGISPFDPVGDGHRGKQAIAAFFEMAMAPNRIRMDIWKSHAGGDEVANVATVHTTLPDASVAEVDIVAVYRVDADGKILSLRAFWEMDQLRFTPAP